MIRETFRAFHSLQRVIAVDTDVDIHDPVDVDWAVMTRFNADMDLIMLPNEVGHIRNPVATINPDGNSGTVTKVGMDAMVPYGADKRLVERVRFMDVDLARYEIKHD